MRRFLLLPVVLSLSWYVPAPAAAVLIGLTDGLVAPGFVATEAGGSGFNDVGSGLAFGGVLPSGSDVGRDLIFSSCPNLAECARVTVDGGTMTGRDLLNDAELLDLFLKARGTTTWLGGGEPLSGDGARERYTILKGFGFLVTGVGLLTGVAVSTWWLRRRVRRAASPRRATTEAKPRPRQAA
jgi:hypothetical protein